MKNKWPQVAIVLVLAHLTLMGLGAFSFDLDKLGGVGKVLNYYGELSGTNNSYGFFAPGVSGQFQALFDVIDDKGQQRTVRMQPGTNQEADLRVGNIIDQFGNEEDDPEAFQRSLSASLAGSVFGRYPKAQAVVVRLQEFFPPSMEEYRQGSRPDWKTVYSAKYVHRQRGKTE